VKGLSVFLGMNLLVSLAGLAFIGPDFMETEEGLIDDFYLVAKTSVAPACW